MNDIDRTVLRALDELRNQVTEHELAYQLRRRGQRLAGDTLRDSLDRLVIAGRVQRAMCVGLPVWAAAAVPASPGNRRTEAD